jgi:sortase A
MIVRVQVRRPWANPARWLSHLLLGAGAAMMTIVIWSQVESALYQTVQARYFEQAVQEAAFAEPTRFHQPPPVRGLLQQLRRLPEFNAADPLLIGRLEILRLGVAAMVREGTEPDTLRKAVGHVRGTALPGQAGNFVVAGHRDSFFRSLRLIRNGDEIRVRTRSGSFTYYVEALSVVGPSDVEAVQSTAAPQCTLVTCFPFDYIGPAPRRFVVRAVLER